MFQKFIVRQWSNLLSYHKMIFIHALFLNLELQIGEKFDYIWEYLSSFWISDEVTTRICAMSWGNSISRSNIGQPECILSILLPVVSFYKLIEGNPSHPFPKVRKIDYKLQHYLNEALLTDFYYICRTLSVKKNWTSMLQYYHQSLSSKHKEKDKEWTLFSKNIAYAALVVSCPSKKRGNSVGFDNVPIIGLDAKSDVGSIQGAKSCT